MSDSLPQLYDAHASALYAFLRGLTGNEQDTRDLLQEAFLKLAERPALLAGVRKPRQFLLRMVHRLAIDLHRRRATFGRAIARAAVEEEQSIFAPDPDFDEAAFRIAVSDSLGELPANERAVVHLKLWEDLTFAEIAETLGIPPNTAASRYRHALDKLRARLRPLHEERP